MRLTGAGACLLAVLLAAPGCGESTGHGDPGDILVVTTVAPLTSIVQTIAGDVAYLRVQGLVPEGTNSHTFEPPPSAVRDLARADLIVENGLRLEDPTTELADENKQDDTPILALGDKVLPRSEWIFDFSFPEKDGKPNPHLWTNPRHALLYAGCIRDALAELDPANKERYEAGYTRFANGANALDAAMKRASATVPRKDLLTYHDGYAYFARDYGWRILGAIQPASFEEPSPREVAALIDQIKALKVPAIFGSEVFPSPVLAEIGKATGARYVDTLRDDDLPGKPGEPEHSWLGLMKANFTTMVEALGGDASAVKAVSLVW